MSTPPLSRRDWLRLSAAGALDLDPVTLRSVLPDALRSEYRDVSVRAAFELFAMAFSTLSRWPERRHRTGPASQACLPPCTDTWTSPSIHVSPRIIFSISATPSRWRGTNEP